MRKRLLLINPFQRGAQNLTGVRIFRAPPVGLGYVAALTPSDWDVRLIDETAERFDFEDADLVGITSYTSSVPRAYEIAETYGRRGIRTVMGGIHASMLPDEAARYADSVVVGEAESVWGDVINDFEGNRLKRFYRGEHTSLRNLVRPRSDLYANSYRFKNCLQSARGCPNDCEFCSVSTFNGRRYRLRPVEEVLSELGALSSKYVFFLDDNIMGHGREAEERAIRLFRGMVERGLNKRWVSQVGIDFATNLEVLKWAEKAGCRGVFIGFESINQESLRTMDKARNLRVGAGAYKNLVKRIHDHGMVVAGAFVFGSDGDREDVFARTADFILDANIDGVQLTVLTPLPGTRFYDRLSREGRLLRTDYPRDWQHYTFFEAVFQPKHMSTQALEQGVAWMYKVTCSRLTAFRRALTSLRQTRSLIGSGLIYVFNRGYASTVLRSSSPVAGGDAGATAGGRDASGVDEGAASPDEQFVGSR